ncbi:class I SAM-dependent methyltransferase [Luteococcus japonicus]|uniref:POSSIBLE METHYLTRANSFERASE (METHYLASE) n=1 Tax=Luteococcus japonicus LSP_Lj1 TaxID=1255658 RepID=A0A1R4JFV9_9ACTN|nr:class I SAM-dependent methyltransferase [Luteococcus japonicus]SJN30897.1 POSSIBLE METHYLTRANSFERASE (METHYLASE) [Luteococcus japonicus LSP_Lj1]
MQRGVDQTDEQELDQARPGGGQQGHWVLASLGKRVLRPGGRELTEAMLAAAEPAGRRVVELAPGIGVTAARLLDLQPAGYQAVERDAQAADTVRAVIGSRGQVHLGSAEQTGLPEASADLVVGEAMLTMQPERGKREILAEVRRVLEPGGRYAIHELGLRPDELDEQVKEDIRKDLARAIKVNARPLTLAEWRQLFDEGGYDVEWSQTTEMALLEPRRMLADEGVVGLVRILVNLLRRPEARRRVLGMRRTFAAHRQELCAVALVVRRRP